jgi:gas vesicle protein
MVAGSLLLTGGALLGAGVGFLMAPQSGKDTRKYLFRNAKKVGRKAEGVVGDLADTVSGVVDAVGHGAEEIRDFAHETRKGLIGVLEVGQKRLGKQRARLEKLIA